MLREQQDQTLTAASVSAAVPSLVWARCCLPIAVIYIVLIFVKLWFGCCAKKSKHILALHLNLSVDFVCTSAFELYVSITTKNKRNILKK